MPAKAPSLLIVLLVGLTSCSPIAAPFSEKGDGPSSAVLASLPLYFIENQGQADPRVDYYLQGAGTSVYLTRKGLTFSLTDRRGTQQRWAARLEFVGDTSGAEPIGRERTPALISYFKGNPKKWKTAVPTYSEIVYEDLWPGIDLLYRGDQSRLKYQFLLRPGADPSHIRLAWSGADVSLTGAGELLVSTPAGGLTDKAPVSYQLVGGRRVAVPTAYELEGTSYGFHLGAYDPGVPLVIDPALLIYAGFLGGSGFESCLDVAVDAFGSAYVAGETSSTETTFPESVGPDLTANGALDAFVAKVNPSGTALVYAGFIGGSGSDAADGVALDASGAAYLTGDTNSTEATFPVTVGPDLFANGGPDAFVAKVNTSGTALIYAGFVGGSGVDAADGVAVDPSGAAYLAGQTNSTQATFPVTVGPDLTANGLNDAFVVKVNPSGTALSYAGFLGGTGSDGGRGVAIDSAGSAYLTGQTDSTEATFPETIGPDLTANGGNDAFVAKVSDSAGLVYAGFLGGSGFDSGNSVAVDPSGAAYLAGSTDSSEATFPETVGPDLSANGGFDAYVARVAPSGTALSYAGFIGGSGLDFGRGVAVDASGAAYLTGDTNSTEATLPVAAGPDLTGNGGFDAFLAKVAPSGTALGYAGYIGGSGFDTAYGVAVDASGATYVTGSTDSTEATFPETVGPDLIANGLSDAFIAKVTDNLCVGKGVTIQGTTAGQTITGTSGNDVILGFGGNDTINGAGGNDTICAGDGDDVLVGGEGDDALDGEAGQDTASFPGSTAVTADLAAGTASGASTDTLAGIENLIGSSGKDILRGDGGPNRLQGGPGADRISGRRGADRLGGQGGADGLQGGRGNDRLSGGKGRDRLGGGKGKDRCSGGKGIDTATGCEKRSGVP